MGLREAEGRVQPFHRAARCSAGSLRRLALAEVKPMWRKPVQTLGGGGWKSPALRSSSPSRRKSGNSDGCFFFPKCRGNISNSPEKVGGK